jgi:hypothetical protein
MTDTHGNDKAVVPRNCHPERLAKDLAGDDVVLQCGGEGCNVVEIIFRCQKKWAKGIES